MSILLLDIDKKFNDESLKEFIRRLKALMHISGITYKNIEVLDTLRGHHIYIYVDNLLSDYEICFYQLFLGSDFKRELYNFRRIQNGDKEFNILFSEKYALENGQIILKSYEIENQKLTKLINNEIKKEAEKKTQEALNRIKDIN
jgi:hypothetical protein